MGEAGPPGTGPGPWVRAVAPGVWLAMRHKATMTPVVSVMANLLPPGIETGLRRAGDLATQLRTARRAS